jgi:hypothetical protein
MESNAKTLKIDWDDFKPSKKKTRKKKNSQKNPPMQLFDSTFNKQLNNLSNIISEQNIQSIQPEPEYGNLKHGNKPTYKMLQQNPSNNYNNNINNSNSNNYNNNSNNSISNNYNNNSNNNNNNSNSSNSNSSNSNSNKPRKYKIGIDRCLKTAKVVIQGKKSRRKIKRLIKDTKTENITSVKNDLYNKSLIKCGTTAPPDVLREIYKNTILIGKINNTNGDNLLHNFMSQPIINDDE